jgi:hypothetical protein
LGRIGNGVGAGSRENGRGLVTLKRTQARPHLQCMARRIRLHLRAEDEVRKVTAKRPKRDRCRHALWLWTHLRPKFRPEICLGWQPGQFALDAGLMAYLFFVCAKRSICIHLHRASADAVIKIF